MWITFYAVALSTTAASATIQDNGLNLVCTGGGSANKITGGSVTAWGNVASFIGQRNQGFADEVRLRLNNDEPRIRMPRTMLPPVHGGEDGWFKLKNVEYTEGDIIASIAVNALNNPKLRIDRYTGSISISGKAGDFTGQCQKFDPTTTERVF